MTEVVFPPMLRSRRFRMALVTTGTGLCLGLLGPFGSYLNPGLGWRLLYWCGSIWLGLLVFGGTWLAWRRLAARLGRGRWPALAAMMAGATCVLAAVTRIAAMMIWPGLHRFAPGWGVWYLQSGLIAAAGAAFMCIVRRPAAYAPPASASASASASADTGADTGAGGVITGRPARAARFGHDVIALQMEDHYVRVHTRGGSRLVHMTLTEAMEALGPVEGLRTHRSWWVSRAAVNRVEGTPRAMRLHLQGDVVAPVARGAVALLREKGWLGSGTDG